MDVNGRLVKHLFNGQQQKGIHTCQLNAADLSPGIYIIKLQVDNTAVHCKII